MRTGRPKAELTLTAEEQHTLEQWTRRPKTTQALALGQPASAVWPEIWHDVIVPRVEYAKHQNSGTYDEAMFFVMHRRGYPEEN